MINKLLVLTILVCFASTGVWIELAGIDTFTPFKLIAPLVFLTGVTQIDFRRVKEFNLSFILLIVIFFAFITLNAVSFSSVANIILLGIGFFGTYTLYEKIEHKRRQQIIFILLMVLFVQSAFEIFLLAAGLEAVLFFFPSAGRVDGWITESSHFCFIVLLLCITYFTSFNISLRRQLLLLVCFFPALYFSKSAYGYIFLMISIVIVSYNQLGEIKRNQFLLYFTIAGISSIFLLIFSYQSNEAQRVFNTLEALFSLNDQEMDSTARVRLLPSIMIFQMADSFSTVNLLFGHGLGTSGYFVKEVVGVNTSEGHLASFMYDFGLIGIVWIFTLVGYVTNGIRNKFWIRLMFLIMMLNMNVGTQVFWFSIFCMAVIRFEQRYPFSLNRSRSSGMTVLEDRLL
jgi:hypothetical protein